LQITASLLMGLALRNLPSPLNVAYYIEPHASNHLRELALTVILTRAGLEIDPAVRRLLKMKNVCLKLRCFALRGVLTQT